MIENIDISEGAGILNGIGIPSLAIVVVLIIMLVFLQRDKFKEIIWELVLNVRGEIKEYVKGEMTESESETKEYIYSLYDAIPTSLRVFISRGGYERIVDDYLERLYEMMIEEAGPKE